MFKTVIVLIVILILSGCDNQNNTNNVNNTNNTNNVNNSNNTNNLNNTNNTNNLSCHDSKVILEQEIRDELDSIVTDTEFTLKIQSGSGATFVHSTKTATSIDVYRSASTSKWVTATIIMDLVNDGVLSLDDNPQQYIDFWPTTGNLSQIKLRHLLSFTSGLDTEPLCTNSGSYDFENCINNIITKNPTINTPGTEFHYGSPHLQVAGLMAIKAGGFSNWGEVFDSFRLKTGLFPTAAYDLPSETNPRLAGGMHWTTDEYFEFVKALFEQTILTSASLLSMESDQLNSASIDYSPALDGINEDWHYGFGNWIECHSPTFNCGTNVTRVSSPGAYGAYPFMDYEYNYFGVLGREGGLGTFTNGYDVFTTIEPKLREWASMDCK